MAIGIVIIALVFAILLLILIVKVWIQIGGGKAIFRWSPSAWEHELSRTDIEQNDENA